jgi:anion-transporting  ArsA/GET3 family ATPase
MARAATTHSIADLLAAKEMVVVCGSGGTGKTTVAAALGAEAASRLGGRVLVVTVDPARRLAVALGLADHGVDVDGLDVDGVDVDGVDGGDGRGGAGLGNTPVQVPPEAFAAAGVECRGEMWVAMLDTKKGWDDLIARQAPTAAVRDQVLANPLYRNITGRFVNSHDYIAMEQLHDLHASGGWDLVIIDTPPSRNALDLLDAPGRMREFFGSRLLKWLTVPYRSRLFTAASKPFYQVADRVLGSRFLQDIAEFFVLFQTMEAGFVRRATSVERLLTDDRSTFVVVSTLEAAPAREARYLVDELRRRGMPLGALVLNRTLPIAVRQPAATKSATALGAAAADAALVRELAKATESSGAAVRDVLTVVAERFRDMVVVAGREAERRSELAAIVPQVVAVPMLPADVHDLGSLLAMGTHLMTPASR